MPSQYMVYIMEDTIAKESTSSRVSTPPHAIGSRASPGNPLPKWSLLPWPPRRSSQRRPRPAPRYGARLGTGGTRWGVGRGTWETKKVQVPKRSEMFLQVLSLFDVGLTQSIDTNNRFTMFSMDARSAMFNQVNEFRLPDEYIVDTRSAQCIVCGQRVNVTDQFTASRVWLRFAPKTLEECGLWSVLPLERGCRLLIETRCQCHFLR